MLRVKHVQSNFRLSPLARALLSQLAANAGISLTTKIENLIRDAARCEDSGAHGDK